MNTKEIADVLAQKNARSAEHYTRDADRGISSERAATLLENSNETDLSTRVSTSTIRSVG
jgi:hypothetical protein